MLIKNFWKGSKCLPGKIINVSEPVSFKVQLSWGDVIHCIQDHIVGRSLSDQMLHPEEKSAH